MKTEPQKIVLASGNQGKIRELQQQLESQFSGRYSLVSQNELNVIAPPEDGLSFVENALIKARSACHQTGLPAIADDSGLSVDALSGAPGIYSARFSHNSETGEEATDASNNRLLLEKLHAVPTHQRTARFQCALVFMRHANDPTPLICQGNWEGRIADQPSGKNGFGYDPLFYAFDQNCISAELSSEQKNKVSHRGQAVTKLLQKFANIRL